MQKILIALLVLIFSNVCFSEEKAKEKESTFFEKVGKFFYDDEYKKDPKFKRHRLEFETGVAHVLYNKIGKNIDTGSFFNTASIANNANFYFRIAYYFNLDKKNSFRILVAPFKYSGTGNLDNGFNVDGQNFQQGLASYNYQFNSYRFTYRREIFSNDFITFRLGLTMKIRDAKFNLNQSNSNFSQSDIGFVPLGHFNLELNPFKDFHIIFEGDVAGVPQGRALDIAASLRYDVNEYVDVSLGYRMLEGGAFNKNAYNKAFFNYYFAGVGVKV